MSALPIAIALAAFLASTAMTFIALAEEQHRHAIAGLGLMIISGIILGNVVGGNCGF